ncbi:MAG TPA: AMMECR1 domain-containing protein [Deltaproteobacteria bacterium]|jgi:AmmeMemoRadiSam system protein A|nr:AMMECR1 domain-containing protein [Deltaproteobacteria bacterium]
MPLPETPVGGCEGDAALVEVAWSSIRHGLRYGVPLEVRPFHFESPLQELRASFVTLRIGDKLRGCTGTLEAVRPLVVDVAENAFASAFRDPRFAPLAHDELATLDLHISILDSPERLAVDSEEELLRALRPGRDGLILEEGVRRATFLPAVWDQLPAPRDFVWHLKQKAGLTPDYWSPSLRLFRYAVREIEGGGLGDTQTARALS